MGKGENPRNLKFLFYWCNLHLINNFGVEMCSKINENIYDNLDKILMVEAENIEELYQWKISDRALKSLNKLHQLEKLGINKSIDSKDSNFKKNIILREKLAKNKIIEKELGNWIIKEWGGIKTGKDDELI